MVAKKTFRLRNVFCYNTYAAILFPEHYYGKRYKINFYIVEALLEGKGKNGRQPFNNSGEIVARLKRGGLMDSRSEAKIQKEIRRRAFQRADVLRQQKQLNEKTRHTIVALQAVTGLQRPELDSIAADVKLSHQGPCDTFFSIKRQILITAGVFGLILIFCGLMIIV